MWEGLSSLLLEHGPRLRGVFFTLHVGNHHRVKMPTPRAGNCGRWGKTSWAFKFQPPADLHGQIKSCEAIDWLRRIFLDRS